MQNISFGRIFKVNVPSSIAEKVVYTAKRNTYQFKNSRLLGNPKQAHVVVPNEQDVYIFTGKDGEAYWKSYSEAHDHMEWAHNRYGGDELFDIETDWAFKEHGNWTRQYIENNRKKIKNMNVEYNECGYPLGTVIKSIDIKA